MGNKLSKQSKTYHPNNKAKPRICSRTLEQIIFILKMPLREAKNKNKWPERSRKQIHVGLSFSKHSQLNPTYYAQPHLLRSQPGSRVQWMPWPK